MKYIFAALFIILAVMKDSVVFNTPQISTVTLDNIRYKCTSERSPSIGGVKDEADEVVYYGVVNKDCHIRVEAEQLRKQKDRLETCKIPEVREVYKRVGKLCE